jgi:SAM-dependent methyltransferase
MRGSGSVTAAVTSDEIERHFASWGLPPAVTGYARFHAERYATLLETVTVAAGDATDVLDVGPFLQTQLLREALPGAHVHSVCHSSAPSTGWGAEREGERHVRFDLEDAQHPERRPDLGPFDVVVMAEVIEHLHTAPTLVLACVAGWLKPGGRLVLQTPNAARLDARLKLLAGRNPYEMLREDTGNPGHFREYTVAELVEVAGRAGLRPVTVGVHNYFRYPRGRRRALTAVSSRLPGSFREGITAVFAKAG